jgi:hypothetical protein
MHKSESDVYVAMAGDLAKSATRWARAHDSPENPIPIGNLCLSDTVAFILRYFAALTSNH